MYKVLLLIISIFIYSFSNAQADKGASGQVIGKVIDSSTKSPIEYATITVFRQGEAKAVNGIISDAKGNFKVTNLPFGIYYITVDFIGFHSNKIDSVVIAKANSAVGLGTIALSKKSQTLAAVTVTTTKSIIENKVDKMVYNVDRDVTSQGGVATDVLKKVPQVSVDVNGNVELQGNPNVRFLIDGKPSTIFGNSVADALQSIPASQIQSIEVITSPGAKYDAEGTGGIINILLKKSKVRGINGNINVAAGTRLENGSFNLNYRHNKFGLHAFISGNAQLTSTTNDVSNRLTTDTTKKTTTALNQNGNSNLKRNGFQTGLSFDWSPTKKDNINGSVSYNQFGNSNVGSIYQETNVNNMMGGGLSSLRSNRNYTNSFNVHAIEWSLEYKKTFKKDGQELSISSESSNDYNKSAYYQTQTYLSASNPFAGTSSNNPGTEKEINLSIDYTHPVSEDVTIETGAKTILNTIASDADVFALQASSQKFVLDPTQSYKINYKQNVYAYYLSGSFALFNFLKAKAGARFEHTVNKADYSNASNVAIPSYNTLVPSVVISHSFSNTQSIKLSYSRRIQRPDYRDLNPFINLSDPHNITTGNPNLKPEIGNNFELGFNNSFNKGANVYVALSYRRNTQDIKSYVNYYPYYKVGDSVYADLSVTTRQNIATEYRPGVSISASIPANSKLSFRTNTLVSKRIIHSIVLTNGATAGGVEYRANLNGSYQFDKDLIVEAFGSYESARKNIQGKSPSFISYNIALRKQFLNKKASLGFTTTNPFNKYVEQKTELKGSNFVLNSIRQIPYRSFGISFTYKFGKLEFKKAPEENNPDKGENPF